MLYLCKYKLFTQKYNSPYLYERENQNQEEPSKNEANKD